MNARTWWSPSCGLVLTLAMAATLAAAGLRPHAESGVDFARDVRPILSEKCFNCHGPDAESRQASLRLDLRDDALAPLRYSGFAIVPGDPSASELLRRVSADDEYLRMPPEGEALTAEQIDILRRWIADGAEWRDHWSFVNPERPPLPAVRNSAWARIPIDRFVLARIEAEGLAPQPAAAKEKLLRRVTLDLTGLPPTLAELDAFLADDTPDAYERVVDRLLASPRYGEEMARGWLDLARYADTHGFHFDNERTLWPYRDWVVRAFNENMPFDQFVTEQLAGDLLPDATRSQQIATGFNRCNPTTAEGGLIEEEYLVKYAVDRVNTTATGLLGMTMACAQCHDHKYDPITQREYYEFFAFFNNVDERGTDLNAMSPPPVIPVPTLAQEIALAGLRQTDSTIAESLDRPHEGLDAEQLVWEQTWRKDLERDWRVLTPFATRASSEAILEARPDGSISANGPQSPRSVYEIELESPGALVRALRLETLKANDGTTGPGRASHGNFVLTDISFARAGEGAEPEPLAIASAWSDYAQADFPVTNTIDADPSSGWAVGGRIDTHQALFVLADPIRLAPGERLAVRMAFESDYPQHELARVRWSATDTAPLPEVALGDWEVSGPHYADSGDAAYERDFPAESKVEWVARPDVVDGSFAKFEGERAAVYLRRQLEVAAHTRLTWSLGSDDALRVWLDGAEVLARKVQRGAAIDQDRLTLELTPGTHELVAKVVNYGGAFQFYAYPVIDEIGGVPLELASLLTTPADLRTAAEANRLRRTYRRENVKGWAEQEQRLEEVRGKTAELDAQIPRSMVMKEREERRQAFVLERGAYDAPAEPVSPDVPDMLPPLDAGDMPPRLALARWFIRDDHPLTARVAVNRIWQKHFGSGLVESAEDFGAQGTWPSHPELLDWLAVEFRSSGWNVKAMHRLIVTSATYRQDSAVPASKRARDPANRLLSRGPRFRLDAEALRDQALFAAGLLVEQRGGRGVKPYQPSGLWEAVGYPGGNTTNFRRDEGDALYRRSLYTFWKRTSPQPAMTLLDAPDREACTVRRPRTNTPLQALALLNDVQFVEAARAMAERLMRESPDTDEQLATAFRRVTSRFPDAPELAVLQSLYREQRTYFDTHAAQAAALLRSGVSDYDTGIRTDRFAALTTVCNALLNLDETVTRP